MAEMGLEIRHLQKSFGEVMVVPDLSLQLEKGQILGLLGPSGCGKTTTLRCIAGLETPTGGEIWIGGRRVYGGGAVLPPEERDLGMVFQSYALWPHMNVFNNIAMPLELQRMGRQEIRERVDEVIRLVGLEGLGERFPSQLSGGQQQRVAVARAVVKRPQLLLFDEPLSNLDARLRDQVRMELRELLKRLQLTAVYVTHDQVEAMTLCDQVAIMDQGRLMQLGSPEDLYDRPAARFVATFMGNANIVRGTVQGESPDGYCVVETKDRLKLLGQGPENLIPGQAVAIVFRPEGFAAASPQSGDSTVNQLEGVIVRQVYLGSRREWLVQVGESELRVELDSTVSLGGPGDGVTLTCPPDRVYCIAE